MRLLSGLKVKILGFSCLFIFHLSQGIPVQVSNTTLTIDIKPQIRCTDLYKVVASIPNKKDILPAIKNMQLYSMTCQPTIENTFCLKDDEIEKHWLVYQPCHLSEDRLKVECPLFHQFKTFNDFFDWNLKTVVARIGGIEYTSGTSQYKILFTTKGAVVTPIFKCENGGFIGANSTAFKQN